MADILDQLQDRETRAINQEIGQASHDFDWSRTFMSTPPTEVLRKQRNLVDLVGRATERKMQILAQTNEKAQDIFLNAKRFENEQRMQPLKEELLLHRIDHEEASTKAVGAMERFRLMKDREAAEHQANFLERVGAIKAKRGTPEYREAIISATRDNPAILSTGLGKEVLSVLGEEDDVVSRFNELTQQVPDSRVTVDSSGKESISTATGDGTGGPPESALKELAKLKAKRALEQVYADKEKVPSKKEKLQKNVAALDAAIGAWQETYQPKTDAEGSRPTPVEKIEVQKDGKKYRLPASQLEDALSQGYTRVQ